ncbi:MAG: helix-turn-helix transcriptional regulator [Nitrospinae bacterium]|nr:helix-turn-helix transcriptional regulator [Nitrospinota bacterium]
MKTNFFYNRSFISSIPFVEGISGKRINGLEGAGIQFSSKNLGWDGVVVEKGVQHGWDATDFSVSGHYLAINLSNVSLSFERKTPHGFKREVMPPGTLWLNPTGETFTHRVKQVCTYGAIVLDFDKFERLAGIPKTELRLHYSIQDPQLEYLIRTLLIEVKNQGINGRIFCDSLTAALSAYLTAHFSTVDNHHHLIKGGIPQKKLRLLIDFIEANISADIRLEDLSALVNLSPYHFAREFKRSVGLSPHQYILSRRVELARKLLDKNKQSIADAAYELGFADQSHLTRVFKLHFDITPAEYIRRRKR